MVYSNSLPLIIHGGLESRAYFTMTEDTMQFHLSWDWLMPVVKRIYDLCKLEIKEKSCPSGKPELRDVWCDIMEMSDEEVFLPVLITKLYKSIIEFIKWYNKEK